MLFAKIKQHYEAVVAVCCFLILFTNVGLPSTSFSVYQPYLVDLPGVGHSGGSIIVSVRTFVSLLAMLVVGRYYDLVDCRIGAFLATLSVSAGFALYSLAGSNFGMLCGASALTGLGYGFGGMIASTMLINRWFRANVATVAGVAAVGSGVAAIVIPNAAVALISAFDLQTAFRAEAVLALVIGVTVFALLRNDPRDMGLTPYEGSPKVVKREQEKSAQQLERVRKRHVNRDLSPRTMPLLFLAMIIIGCVSVGGGNYLAVLFTSEGFSAEHAATLVAVNGACLTVAKLVSGMAFDRFGTKRGSSGLLRPVYRGHGGAVPVGYGQHRACRARCAHVRYRHVAWHRGHFGMVDRAGAARQGNAHHQELPGVLRAGRVHLHLPAGLFDRGVRHLRGVIRGAAGDAGGGGRHRNRRLHRHRQASKPGRLGDVALCVRNDT